MKFKLSKLSLESHSNLSPFSLDSVEAFRPLTSPVYLLMTKNSKYVSIKAPFDFFSPKDLSKLAAVKDSLFVSKFDDHVKPFKEAAQKIKAISHWTSQTDQKEFLEITPYEQSDQVLNVLGKLWSITHDEDNGIKNLCIESYFAAVLGSEVCEPLPGDPLVQAREADVDRYELALLRSGVFVFFALHLGYLDLHYLSEIRKSIFLDTVNLLGIAKPVSMPHELDQLKRWVDTVISKAEVGCLTSQQLQWSLNRVIQKIKWRLERVRNEIASPEYQMPTVYGDGGLYEKPSENPIIEEVSDVG